MIKPRQMTSALFASALLLSTTQMWAEEVYSPYASKPLPRVLWGDTHLHTGMSPDAGAFGARLMPEDAYRFARGDVVVATTGQQARLSRPLDFLVVSDHSDLMGFFPRLHAGDPAMLADPTGRRWYDMTREGGQQAVAAAIEVVLSLTTNSVPEALNTGPGSEAFADAWKITTDAAEAFYQPGQFTSFIGYEWTSTESGDNRHRVVMYRDGALKARQVDPMTSLTPLGSPDERALWRWMRRYESETGGDVLAIGHNGNLSNGQMFPTINPWTGEPLEQAYLSERARWEPVYEVTQIKGDGETHPLLSPDDEFADYETWDRGNLDLSAPKTPEMLPFEYARSGLQIGLQLERAEGINPYKFGMIGATDSHTGLATAAEDNFFGKHSGIEPSARRLETPMARVSETAVVEGWQMVASGLAGVWALENTREAIFDAIERKETYATTGPRIIVQLFASWHFPDRAEYAPNLMELGYQYGVPMGGDLKKAPEDAAPEFLIAAQKDPLSGNLDRIQIVKGWINPAGERQERIFDVVWSDPSLRRLDESGHLPSLPSTVNVATASYSNQYGAPSLSTLWRDPEFDPEVPAVYYARVLEVETPRWVAYDAARFGVDIPEASPVVTQERAYTSPVWYTPPTR